MHNTRLALPDVKFYLNFKDFHSRDLLWVLISFPHAHPFMLKIAKKKKNFADPLLCPCEVNFEVRARLRLISIYVPFQAA